MRQFYIVEKTNSIIEQKSLNETEIITGIHGNIKLNHRNYYFYCNAAKINKNSSKLSGESNEENRMKFINERDLMNGIRNKKNILQSYQTNFEKRMKEFEELENNDLNNQFQKYLKLEEQILKKEADEEQRRLTQEEKKKKMKLINSPIPLMTFKMGTDLNYIPKIKIIGYRIRNGQMNYIYTKFEDKLKYPMKYLLNTNQEKQEFVKEIIKFLESGFNPKNENKTLSF